MIDLSKFGLNKNDVAIVAVSGGPDSMALLDMLVKSGYHPIICHVNYHHRPTSNRDEDIVKNYAESRALKIYVKESFGGEGNFQTWAREVRYNFFAKIYEEVQAKALITAHQQDDALETYLFKKMRNSVGDSLTIREEEKLFGMRLIRPLLNLTKQELLDYCKNNKVIYGIDESNLTRSYSRNKIRLDIVNGLSISERMDLLEEMNNKETIWQEQRKKAYELLKKNPISYKEFESLSMAEKKIVLYELLVTYVPQLARHTLGSFIAEIIKAFSSNKANVIIPISKDKSLSKSYDIITIIDNEISSYSYTINRLEELTTNEFKIALTGIKMEGIYVEESDFPLTIRVMKADDVVSLKEGHKSLKRLFIDKKVPSYQRSMWPIIVNAKQEIILVPLIYRLYRRKGLQNNLYVIKYTNSAKGN